MRPDTHAPAGHAAGMRPGACVLQVCPRANVLTPEGVAAARQRGLSVRAWGVKTLQVGACGPACQACGSACAPLWCHAGTWADQAALGVVLPWGGLP
jgi:hypothetical protein